MDYPARVVHADKTAYERPDNVRHGDQRWPHQTFHSLLRRGVLL